MKEYKLLHYHMDNVHPMYIFGHAIVAGRLASRDIKSCSQYKDACSEQGINSYPGAWKEWAADSGLVDESAEYDEIGIDRNGETIK